jgi:hypothetical protein
MFWLDNLNTLLSHELIPNNYMSIDEKLNAVIRMVMFFGIIATLIFNDSRYILLVLILMTMSILIYNYQYEKIKQTEKYLNDNDLELIDNKRCVKPSKNNPFMNPDFINMKFDDDLKACSIDNKKIQDDIQKYFYMNVFREIDDIYDKSLFDRQFYTVPSSTIPDERDKLTDWLYKRGPSCKESNGLQCYNNLYNELQRSNHY